MLPYPNLYMIILKHEKPFQLFTVNLRVDHIDNKRKKMKNATQIGDILSDVIESFEQNSDMRMVDIWKLWDTIVEPHISENARPAAFRKKLLLVHVSSSSWVQQLQFMKKEILNKANKVLGQNVIEEIKFKIGPV